MATEKAAPMEISMAHGNFHPPWKIPWPMEISMLGLMSGWTRGEAAFVAALVFAAGR